MKLVRAMIGLFSLAGEIVILAVLASKGADIIDSGNQASLIGSWLMLVWLFLSALSKVGMVIGTKTIWLGEIALIAWGIFLVFAYAVAPAIPVSGQSTLLGNILISLLFFGLPTIDLVDTLFIQPTKK